MDVNYFRNAYDHIRDDAIKSVCIWLEDELTNDRWSKGSHVSIVNVIACLKAYHFLGTIKVHGAGTRMTAHYDEVKKKFATHIQMREDCTITPEALRSAARDVEQFLALVGEIDVVFHGLLAHHTKGDLFDPEKVALDAREQHEVSEADKLVRVATGNNFYRDNLVDAVYCKREFTPCEKADLRSLEDAGVVTVFRVLGDQWNVVITPEFQTAKAFLNRVKDDWNARDVQRRHINAREIDRLIEKYGLAPDIGAT